jgi:hypothetical protein
MCGVEFANVFARNAHMANQHRQDPHDRQDPAVPDKVASEAIKCELCDRTFETAFARDGHMTTHQEVHD